MQSAVTPAGNVFVVAAVCACLVLCNCVPSLDTPTLTSPLTPRAILVWLKQTGQTYTYTFRHNADGWLCDANT